MAHAAAQLTGESPVAELDGVGPALTASLKRLGCEKLRDLWFHLPLRYEDRTRIMPIRDLVAGEHAQIVGVVDAVEGGFRYRPQLKVGLSDESGASVLLRFFHFSRAQSAQLTPGTRLRCFGEVRWGVNGLEMVHPQYTRLAAHAKAITEDRLTAVYPTTEGLGQKRLAKLIDQALAFLPPESELELIPEELRSNLQLGSLREALLFMHHPPPETDLALLADGSHAARQRLAFEELLSQHLGLKRLRQKLRHHRAHVGRGASRHPRPRGAWPVRLVERDEQRSWPEGTQPVRSP